MFPAILALTLAPASAQPAATLTSSRAWWERVTVTVSDDGQTRSCRYESSLRLQRSKDCSVIGSDEATARDARNSASGSKDEVTRITFERRFSPSAKPDLGKLQPGDTLLGGQVMALSIDGTGTVKHCQVVARSGAVIPQYGCHEATAERFEARATSPHARMQPRAGYLSILVYGHSEHLV
ncbi:MAG TPA: hypothetical protein VM711_05480 [Sphingomicrobium sp.]|nr:hypothetical protein [Sphingomicrobium sp.]